jgi:hypothetical protein
VSLGSHVHSVHVDASRERLETLNRALRWFTGVAALVTATVLVMLSMSTPVTAGAEQAPNAPTELRATSVGFDSFSLEWTRAPGDDGRGEDFFYQVLLDGVWRSGSYTPSVSLSGLREGTTYEVEVRSLDTVTNEASSGAAITVETLSDREAPSAPRNLRADATGLRWDASTDNRGVGHYQLYINGQHVRSTTATEIDWTFLEFIVRPGQRITAAVQAVDLSGLASPLSAPLVVTVP